MPSLELLTAAHAPAVLAFELENRAYFTAAVGDRGDGYFEEFETRLATLLTDQAAGAGAFYVLVEGGSVIGRFNLELHADGLAELGYRVAESAAGRGLASTTVRELSALAGARHGVRTLRAATTHDNVASRRVLANAGFVEVGPADPDEIGGGTGTRWERAAG